MRFLPIILLAFFLNKSCSAAPAERQETDPELTAGYFEGDMVMERERNGLIDENVHWKNGIVFYHISSNIDQAHRNHIIRGIRLIEASSCIIFKEAATDQPYYINVTSENSGCHSYVGFRGRVQQVNLQHYDLNVGCFRLGTIVHEFLHALGFYHQQSTWNRDDFVRIAYENIVEGRENNFKKLTNDAVDNYGVAYDYGSVMHYGPYGFSKNGEKTIETLQPNVNIGQRLGMSQGDINKLNRMYKCPKSV